jgi:hypothetical protein
MGLRRCDRKSVGASSGNLRRPVAFNSLSICNARRHALCSPSTSWVNSKASSNAGENLRSIPWRRTMPWKRSLRLPVTHSPILSTQATNSSRETAAKSRARSSSSEMASSRMILPSDLKAVCQRKQTNAARRRDSASSRKRVTDVFRTWWNSARW